MKFSEMPYQRVDFEELKRKFALLSDDFDKAKS